jgi:putative salt-induced outer membrane protein YdiY
VALVLTTNQDPSTCEPATVRSLLTDVWRLVDGQWRLALRHSGPAGGVATQFTRQAPPPPLAEGSAELSLVNTGGNSDTQTLGLGGALTWRPGAWTTDARVAFVRTASESVETARSLVLSVRQARRINDRLDAFGRFEHLMNEFAGIDNRVSTDGGFGYRVVTAGAHTLRLDGGVGYSREDRVATDTLSFALVNLGAAYRWKITATSTLTDNGIYTASLDDQVDWRFGNALAFTTTVNRVFSVKLSHELKFVNRPVLGFEKTDTVLSAALVARF